MHSVGRHFDFVAIEGSIERDRVKLEHVWVTKMGTLGFKVSGTPSEWW